MKNFFAILAGLYPAADECQKPRTVLGVIRSKRPAGSAKQSLYQFSLICLVNLHTPLSAFFSHSGYQHLLCTISY